MQHNSIAFSLSLVYYYELRRDTRMRRLEVTDREIMQIALRNEILRSEEARYDHRLHGVLLVSQGMSCYEVGEIFGHHPTTIHRWIRSFERSGFSGLEDHERPGRPQRLTPEGLEIVNRDLRRSPREFGYALRTFGTENFCRTISRKRRGWFWVRVSVKGCFINWSFG